MISKGFLKHSFIYAVAGALPMASAIVLLPFYIHYLSTDLFGALSLYLAFSLLIQIIVTYSFDSSVYIHFHEFKKDNQKLAVFISSAFIFMLLLGAVVGLVFALSGDFIFKLLLPDKGLSFYPYGLASLGTGIFQAIFRVNSSLLQTRQQPETYFWSNVLNFSMIAGFTIAGFKLFPGALAGPVMGRLLASVISGCWVLFKIYREFGIHFDFSWLKKSFSFNNYTFIYQLQQWLINYFDRMLMVFFLPLSDIGVYDFTLKCLLIVEFLAGGFHNSFLPKVVGIVMEQQEKKSTIEINRYYNGLTGVIMMLVCACILFFPIGIGLLNKADYRESIAYIPYAALIYLLRSLRLYFVFPYSVLKYAKPLPVFYMVVAATKIILMVALIPYFKLYGVILASLVSAFVELVLLRMGLRGKFLFRFNDLKMIYAPAVLFLLIALSAFFQQYIHRELLHAAYLLLSFLLLLWVYRVEIRSLNLLKVFKG